MVAATLEKGVRGTSPRKNEAVQTQVEALCNCALPLCVGVISTRSTVLKAKWTKSVRTKVFAFIQCLALLLIPVGLVAY